MRLESAHIADYAVWHVGALPRWWAWCPAGERSEVEDLLARLAEEHPEAAEHSSSIDWHKRLKLGSPGEQVADEMECALRLANDAVHQEEFKKMQAGLCDLTALSSWVQHRAYSTGNNSLA